MDTKAIFKKFISPDKETAYDSKKTFDNGVIFACSAEFMDTSESNIYLIKLDSTMAYPHPYYNSLTHQNDYTSISKKEKKKEFSIYPNPSSSIANVNLRKFNEELVTITIFDSYGKLILNESTSEINYFI